MSVARTCRYSARWVLPVTAPPIADGAVLVSADGIILEVGPRSVVRLPEGAEDIRLEAAVLLPGLVNVHTHPELTAFRGLLDDLPFEAWIPTLNRIKRAVMPSDEEYGIAARWACVESLMNGITTLGATEDSGAALDACIESGMRGLVYREVFGPAPGQAPDAFAGLRQKVVDMRARATDLVRVGISPHAPYTVSDALFELCGEMARTEELPIAVHAAEAEVEDLLVREGRGTFAEGLRSRGIDTPVRARSTIALLERTGVLAARPLLIHCVRIDGADIARIADAGAAVAHCPVANARLGHGTAPVTELIAAGVRVAIGTDSVASNNRVDILEEARIAQIAQRARLRSPDALASDVLLRLATIDGARALGMESRIGSLERGKDADLCAVALHGTHVQPVHDLVGALFHSARGSDVLLSVVRGRVLYRAGRVLTLDADALADRLREFADRLGRARDEARET
jgi:cytosine/adenosine deaminase-related metal-dependent hydrolase